MSIAPMRPTSRTITRRAKNHNADWLLDRRTTPKRVNRKTGNRAAIRESVQDFA